MFSASAVMRSRKGLSPSRAFRSVVAATVTLTIVIFFTVGGAQAHYSNSVPHSREVTTLSIDAASSDEFASRSTFYCDDNAPQFDGACCINACCSACSTGIVAIGVTIVAGYLLRVDALQNAENLPRGAPDPELQPPRLYY